MRHNNIFLLFTLALLLGALPTWAGKPVWGDSGSTGTYSDTLTERHALAGPHCMVNRVFNTISVGAMTHNLDNLTDEDLTNTASFPSLVSVGAGLSPIVSVRDLSRHYAAGTTAGYRMVASSGSSVVNLDLVHLFKLRFYLNGVKVGEAVANDGAKIDGLKLSLIQIPGSDNMCFDIEAQAPAEFDEVELVAIKVLSADVISSIRLKYAYVGKGKLYTITKGDAKTADDIAGGQLPNLANYCHDMTPQRTLDASQPITGSSRVIDDDLTTGKPYGIVLGLGWFGEANVQTYPADGKELFDAGSSVGFKVSGLSALSLKVGCTAVIKTYDRKGDTQETFSIGGSVLGLNVVNDGDGTIEAETTKAFSSYRVDFLGVLVNVGGNSIKYSFVRPAPEHDHHCPIRISANMNICDSRTAVMLNHNDSIPVTWSVDSVVKVHKGVDTKLASYHATVDANGYVTGMDYKLTADETNDGDYFVYTITATAADGCHESVSITRPIWKTNDLANCVTPIHNTASSSNYAIAENVHGGGSLISMSKISNAGNILDSDKDNYATLTEGLQVGSHVEVVGVLRKDGTSFRSLLSDADKTDPIRVGFVAQMASTGISLKLLHGFTIHCYKQGKDVYNHIVSQSDVLGLGLIGSNEMQKISLAITVPYQDKDKNVIDFDEIALFSDGVLKVGANNMQIFYPFVESGDSSKVATCENPLACDPLVLNNSTDNSTVLDGGATIDHDLTGNVGTADVGAFMFDVSNIVDGDLTTYCNYGAVAKVGGGYRIAVNLGKTLDYRHQLGIVMDKQDDKALEAEVGGWMTIETYRNGVPTGDKKTDWKVLGADVLTMNENQNIYVMNPKQPYDEVVITLAAVADVLKFQKIYGIVIQDDADGDGVPDCKDEESCTTTVSDIHVNDVCQGGKITVTWTGQTQTDYYVALPEQDIERMKYDKSTANAENAVYAINDVVAKKAGICTVFILDSCGNKLADAIYTVHPLVTRWKADAIDSDWEKWDNWTNGSPYLCSDVIIPSQTKHWPVLQSGKTNGCNGIHFLPGGAVERAYLLNYDSAWVDLGMTTGEQTLFMAPLQETFGGDLYALQGDTLSDDSFFKPLDDNLAPENRIAPFVYQRVWKSAEEKDMTQDKNWLGNDTFDEVGVGDITGSHDGIDDKGNTLTTTVATWSHAFNLLSKDHSLTANKDGSLNATCFSLSTRYTDDTNGLDIIRLPKDGQRTYNYYNDFGDKLGKSETVTHDAKAYRFGYEVLGDTRMTAQTTEGYTDRKVFNMDDGLTVNYTHDESAKGVTEDGVFLVGNPLMAHLNIAQFLNVNTAVSSLTTWNGTTANTVVIVDGKPVSTNWSQTDLNPAQAFFVQQNATTKTNTLQLTYTSDMYEPIAATAAAKGYAATTEATTGALRIVATEGQRKAGTLLLDRHDIMAPTILDGEVKPALAIFSVNGGKAYDVQPLSGDIIPLGIITNDSVTLSFEALGDLDLGAWTLCDRATGFCYPLDAPVKVVGAGTTIGRYVLQRGATATAINGVQHDDDVTVETRGAQVVVTSRGTCLQAASLTTLGGMTVDSRKATTPTRSLTLQARPGICLVTVSTVGGDNKVYKVVCR